MFSFNSPLGACESCRGFGRTIDIDLDLVVPDPMLSLKRRCNKAVANQSCTVGTTRTFVFLSETQDFSDRAMARTRS